VTFLTEYREWPTVAAEKMPYNGIYSVSQKNPPLGVLTFFIFFHKRLRIFNQFFTHLL